MERIHFPKEKPIIIDKLDGEAILVLVYKEKNLSLDARWALDVVEKLAERGLLTGLMKMINDMQTQLLDIKLAAEDRARKEIEKQLSKKAIEVPSN